MNLLLTIFYLLIWTLTLIWYQRKSKNVDAGSAIIATYILYAAVSIISITDSLFSSLYEPLKIFPYIYLYAMLMIALSPTIYNHLHPADEIADPHTKILAITAAIAIISALCMIPNTLKNFNSGFIALFTDMSAGNKAYMEAFDEAGDAGSGISNLPAIIYNSLSNISVFLFFYFISKKKHRRLTAGLALALLISILQPLMDGQRGMVIASLLTVIGGYMLFRRYYSKRFNRAISVAGIILVLLIALPIGAITISRFGTNDKAKAGVASFISWYVGQGSLYFNNYGLDDGGIRYGDRTLNLFKRVVDPSTPKNFVERRQKYGNLKVNDEVFTTFVGDFTIDFGPIAATVIFIVFNSWVVRAIRPRDGTLEVHQMLLLFFTVCICMQGGMTLFIYSDGGNLQIITFAMLYSYLRYHGALLRKFPLKAEEAEAVNDADNKDS